MNDYMNDTLLNIKTIDKLQGLQQHDSLHYHPYEPTPYQALDKLFRAHPLSAEDRFVDFGCGKGRSGFVANYLFSTTVIGIEMNEAFYREAIQNRSSYVKKHKSKSEKDLIFHCSLAQEYKIQPTDNIFYFFNPFSIQIFIAVIHNILKSYEEFERDLIVVLYYGSQEYFYYLEDYTPFELINEIRLEEHDTNPYERFLIYHLTG